MTRTGTGGALHSLDTSGRAMGYDLDDVKVVLFSPLQNSRRIILDAVHGAGFRHVNVVNSIEALRRAVQDTGMDMLVLETNEHAEAVCQHIQDIRHGRLGSNPFLVINVITWKPSDDVIRTFVNAGADDIIVMPISIGAVTSRVDNIIENRKKFVATSLYVGPDRRQPGRRNDSELAAFDVPNGLRYKATGDESAKVDMARIERANSIVREHRLRRTTLQLRSFAATMQQFIKGNPNLSVPANQLSDMSEMVQYIARHTENDSRKEILNLVESLQKVMNEAEADARSETEIFALLAVHADALLALLRGEKEAADLVVRAVFTATKILETRLHKRRGAAENGAEGSS
ncbi:MAG: hypothetical protein O3B21_13765 [Proteobacteria bacterium]|nr:hypothetical protein [Pseudomonadota bacterium]MDA1357349.1 hypothetical protein [Pseudomonadota bacterium]